MTAPRLPVTADLTHPTLVSRPFHRDGWIYEEKVDGWRMLAYKRGADVRLISRHGRDHTARFPGIVSAIRALEATPLVLDGEVAVFDQTLISRFSGCGIRHPQISPRRRSS